MKDYTEDISFWIRLRNFVCDVQINCKPGEEEQEMIISVCDKKIKEKKKK